VFVSVIVRSVRCFFSPYTFAIWFLLVLGAVVISPFGTYAPMSLETRAVFWAIIGAAGILLGHALHVICSRVMEQRHQITRATCETGLFTVLFSPFAYAMAVSMSDRLEAGVLTSARISFFVLIAAVMIRAMRRILQSDVVMENTGGALRPSGAALPPAPSVASPSPRLMRRLPDRVKGPILHLSARDHFVTVETPEGAYELRMRLRDAIDEMDNAEGLRTHRSHWVAEDAIVDARREEGRVVLVLKNGAEVPVSRKYRPDVEDSGLI